MKKTFAIGVIFLLTYLGFLIATLPTTVVLNQVSLPKNIALSGVSGTVWHTQITQLNIEKTHINKVDAQLSFWSLFTLTPTMSVTFGDSFSAGPEGSLELALSTSKATLSDVTILMSANEIAQQLPLPLPVTAKGDVEITIAQAAIDLQNNNQCLSAKGQATWSKAGVVALERNIALGQLTGDITCENGAPAFIIAKQNNLGLTFNAYVNKRGKVTGNGHLKPGANFPKALKDALPFLGKKDRQGRYRLNF